MPLTLNVLSVNRPNGDGLITRISTAADGTQANFSSYSGQVSVDGHYVVFASDATNLGAGAVSGGGDLFRKNPLTGVVELISAGLNGAAANDASYNFSSSANGSRVVFDSRASNLVEGDDGKFRDIFVKDFTTSSLVSITAGGNAHSGNARLSAKGQYVVFESYATNLVAGDTADTLNTLDIFRKDLVTGAIVRLAAIEAAVNLEISDDGRYLTFQSSADNLVDGDDNGATDIFRKDLQLGTIQRLSVNGQGGEAIGGASFGTQFSADGRYMVFGSSATNLIAGDTNETDDVFRKNLATGDVVRVSTGVNGEANGHSYNARISADGRYVTFESAATNLVAGDTNTSADIFRKDMLTGAIERLSTATLPVQGKVQGNGASIKAQMSAGGRYVTFESAADNLAAGDTNHATDIFRRDLATGEIVRVSVGSAGEADEHSANAQTSADGRYVTFDSFARTLAPGDASGSNFSDIFVRDLQQNTTARISARADGTLGNGDSYDARMSADGQRVVFTSEADNLLGEGADSNGVSDIFLCDMSAATPTLVRVSTGGGGEATGGGSSSADLSADGHWVAFESHAHDLVTGDGNGKQDIFLKDTRALNDAPILVSVAADGITQASADSWGAQVNSRDSVVVVVFTSDADNLLGTNGDGNGASDIFLFRQTGTSHSVIRVSTGASGAEANKDSFGAQVSADGRFVTFSSSATNLVTDDTNNSYDIFVKDLDHLEAAPIRVSTGINGQANGDSYDAQISADGRYVTFTSVASNLVADDTNNSPDIFRKDLQTGAIERISVTAANAQGREQGNNFSYNGSLTADGRFVVLGSAASNLVPGDTNGMEDLFLVDAERLPDALAMRDGRHIELKLGVGAASRVGMAWGDGTSETVTASGGVASLSHIYAAKAAKDSVISVYEGDQTWAVHYTLDVASGALSRNTALADTLSGGAGGDALTGDAYGNVLVGNAGNDTLDGAAGADRLEGGSGSDVLLVDNAADLVVENAGGGMDAVKASVSYGLSAGAEVEMLTALGAGALQLTGSETANAIRGNAAANGLNGQGGDDKLYGGLGKDVLSGGRGHDIFVFDSKPNKKTNLDKVTDFSVRDDSIWLDNAVMSKLGRKGSETRPAKLGKAFFALDKAKDGNDHVIYVKATGVLYYDSDGSGGKAAVQIATLSKKLKMTAADFFVV